MSVSGTFFGGGKGLIYAARCLQRGTLQLCHFQKKKKEKKIAVMRIIYQRTIIAKRSTNRGEIKAKS